MKDGFLRVACATPELKIADCEYNYKNIVALAKDASNEGTSLVVFPELCITAYTCGDLFFQSKLLKNAKECLLKIASETAYLDTIIIAGLPVSDGQSLYNCAAVVYHGDILGIIPKTFIPNYSEFYEMRHFKKGCLYKKIRIGEKEVPFGTDIMFACNNIPEFKFGVEICEDLWTIESPSCKLAKSGANIIANLSASNELIGKDNYRRNLIKVHSSKLICAYLLSNAGQGESTTDIVFSGHNIIAETGVILSESEKFSTGLIFSDIDLHLIEYKRTNISIFPETENINTISFDMPSRNLNLKRKFRRFPFVPKNDAEIDKRCMDILNIQSNGLAERLRHTGIKRVLFGLSGGLDSTLALIVCIHAFDKLCLDKKDIIAITMPCFGTTQKTLTNAEKIAKIYGVTLRKISIEKSVSIHFEDIGHNPENHDVTFENAQARERTQVLMDIANQVGGLVVGTGDLSEIALGWATYNGDIMSMYSVNASVPKTLVRYLVGYEAKNAGDELKQTLNEILDTPVSPELLPPKDGNIDQKTEEIVGPYELHDFFLYYFIRFGYPAEKILRIAKDSFEGVFDEDTIKKWLHVFIDRFFTQQFKRSSMPDGPKVGSVNLSPRGDWRMPSDISSSPWFGNL